MLVIDKAKVTSHSKNKAKNLDVGLANANSTSTKEDATEGRREKFQRLLTCRETNSTIMFLGFHTSRKIFDPINTLEGNY
ncbi:MAG: hypothetical protein ACYTX0_57455, partial [Nostoc sp.]